MVAQRNVFSIRPAGICLQKAWTSSDTIIQHHHTRMKVGTPPTKTTTKTKKKGLHNLCLFLHSLLVFLHLRHQKIVNTKKKQSHLPDPERSIEKTETSCGRSTGRASKAWRIIHPNPRDGTPWTSAGGWASWKQMWVGGNGVTAKAKSYETNETDIFGNYILMSFFWGQPKGLFKGEVFFNPSGACCWRSLRQQPTSPIHIVLSI